ncbi:Tripartite-type tricarboxylate transporter, receptor component TctC [Colwellia chukchiensis]|uniref:Tripartite-type tricarboxylate transporter, receptor component TctC n=1 Tax=Colwellia chukchiensis TaxID=641665 RepID=A0A1H7N6E1_9GAMM|nr:tripartite tricarboxylate transporter substrate-binding protein [Colwellia chukchiensis]SEL19196.1 Tripartite-type tricarboxylate transporter, receptor component TctC [Colwellia chukchiensis]
MNRLMLTTLLAIKHNYKKIIPLTLIHCLFFSHIAFAQEESEDVFPNRPITMVVGFGVGGGTDQMARSLSKYYAEELGQPVQVVNKKGAGTLIAANYVLNKPDDGYTIFASGFNPYLTNTILEGNADYGIEDFAYLNFQWFDEDLIAVFKESKYQTLQQLMAEIRTKPKTVRAAVVRGSGGHLIAKLLLDVTGIPQENLNLVTYNSGGKARAAVAGGVVDFIIISAKGSESIREYIRPLAIISDSDNEDWGAMAIGKAVAPMNVDVPVLQGTIRGFATTTAFKEKYPERFAYLADAMERTLQNKELQALLKRASISGRWTGPEKSEELMKVNFEVFKKYAYLLKM